jgi:ABC-2 type transport system ATP-binding protein
VVVVRDGDTAVPAIFRTVEDAGAEISSITLKKPSLDDVYLSFTGRELRQESGTREDAMRERMRMRRIRR